jgi:DNA-binding beta-propeller fold protein YncE
MTRLLCLLASAATALAVLPGPAAASGILRPAACVVDLASHRDGDGCTVARALGNTAFHAVSPDGRHVYATARLSNAVVVLRRDGATGALTQPAGAAGCIAQDAPADLGCAPGSGLDRASGVVVSPDGRHVYVSAVNSDTVLAFARDARTGALQPVGCLLDEKHAAIPGCTPAPGLDGPTHLAISPDGAAVAVASTDGFTVTMLARDGGSGALAFAGCVRDAPFTTPAACGATLGLRGVRAVVFSPDGRNVYAAGSTSNTVVAFARDAAGGLVPLGCLTDAGDPTIGCTPTPGLDYAQFLAVSPDGATVYASGTDVHVIVALARDAATGILTPVPAPDGCISDITDSKVGACNAAVGLSLPLGIAITADGRTVHTGAFGYGSVATFQREPTTGVLSQFGPCWSNGDPYCDRIEGLGRAGFIALTPDERFLGVNAPDASRISVLARGGVAGAAQARAAAARVRRGRMQIRVTCSRKAPITGCVGEARLAVARRAVGGVVDVSTAAPYDLSPGASATVALRLLPQALRTLNLGRRFRAVAIATSHDPTGDDVATTARGLVVRR